MVCASVKKHMPLAILLNKMNQRTRLSNDFDIWSTQSAGYARDRRAMTYEKKAAFKLFH